MDWIWLFAQIMLINIVLSGDNAVVIALASKNLPKEQRSKAVWWGAFGAVALRILLTLIAVQLLEVPYIQAFGALLLLWIAVKLLTDDENEPKVKEAPTLGKAIWTIIVADFVMSLDNVLAIAAKADGNTTVIILGIALSIPLIVGGSTLVMKLLHRYPVLVYLGAAVLGLTAGEMLLSDQSTGTFLSSKLPEQVIPLFGGILVITAGLLKRAYVQFKT